MDQEPGPMIDFDEILEATGQFGRYQLLTTMFLSLASVPIGAHAVASVFEAAVPDFSCFPPDVDNVASVSPAGKYFTDLDACKMTGAQFNSGDVHVLSGDAGGATTGGYGLGNATTLCERFYYDDSVFKSTIVTEWDLVCDRAWMRALSTSMFMLGNLIGVFMVGHVADRFGRTCLFWLNLLAVASGSAAAFAPDYWSYTLLRLVTGSATMGMLVTSFTHGMEVVGMKYRKLFGAGIPIPFIVGMILLAGIAYFIRHYTWLQLTISLGGLLLIPPLYWVGESPRWLLRQGRYEDADREIKRMARLNGLDVPAEFLGSSRFMRETGQEPDPGREATHDVRALLKTPYIRFTTLVLCYSWLVIAMVYYGLSLGASSLAGSPFLNLALMGLVEIPAVIFLYLAMDKIGRKPILCGSLLIGGFACLAVGVVPNDIQWLVSTLALAGKLFLSTSFGIIYVYTAEVYPTDLRAVGVGCCSMFARVGSLLAPFVEEAGNMVWPPLTQVVFGSLSILAALICLVLPETLGRKLPESLEDGESFAKMTCPCTTSTPCSTLVPDESLTIQKDIMMADIVKSSEGNPSPCNIISPSFECPWPEFTR